MILINFKIYKETFGDKGIKLAKICKEIADKSGVRIVISASALEAYRIAKETGAEVWLQKIEEQVEGKHSGFVSSWQAKEVGINGSLINHSENKVPKGRIYKILKNKNKDFELVVCLGSISQIENWSNKQRPEWFLYEPPELIASVDSSVAKAKPNSIEKCVRASGDTPLLVGAGIKSKEDVQTSLNLGAKGVGLSSAFVFSQDPRKLLESLVDGFRML